MVARACEACRKAKIKCQPIQVWQGEVILVKGEPVDLAVRGLEGFEACRRCYSKGDCCSGAEGTSSPGTSRATESPTMVIEDEDAISMKMPEFLLSAPGTSSSSPSVDRASGGRTTRLRPPVVHIDFSHPRFGPGVLPLARPPRLPLAVMEHFVQQVLETSLSNGSAYLRDGTQISTLDLGSEDTCDRAARVEGLWKELSATASWSREPFNYPELSERSTLQ